MRGAAAPAGVEALQQALAAEHAALYVFAALGARTSRSADPELAALLDGAYDDHRDQRDQLEQELLALGATPVAAAAVYDLPSRLTSAERIRHVGLTVERACTATYADAVASTAGRLRRSMIAALTRSALAHLRFGGTPEPFPGAGELDGTGAN